MTRLGKQLHIIRKAASTVDLRTETDEMESRGRELIAEGDTTERQLSQREEYAPFPMASEEAAELGMTYSEWMRHRWTDEFPQRLKKNMDMTFREQTARLDSPPPEIVSDKKDEAVPIFESQELFALWSHQTLSRLADMASEPIDQKFTKNIEEMLELSRIWCLAAKPYEQIPQNLEHEAFMAKISLELRRRLSGKIDFHKRADIADIYGWIENGAEDHKLEFSLDYPLMFLLEEQPQQVIGELINRDTQAGQLAFKTLINKDDHDPEYIAETAIHVLEPLADRLQREIAKNKTESAREEIEFLERFFNELNTSPNVLATAITRGFDRQLVADATLNALLQDEPNINAGSPNHRLTARIANLVTSLYEPIEDSRPVVPPQLIPYVQKLFSAKVLAWDDAPQAKPVARSFMDLSNKLSIQL